MHNVGEEYAVETGSNLKRNEKLIEKVNTCMTNFYDKEMQEEESLS